MNKIGLYGGSGFVGTQFQSMIEKQSNLNNYQINVIPHRGSSEEIKIALEKLDALDNSNTRTSILYLAENNEITEADKLSSDYIENNVKRLKFIYILFFQKFVIGYLLSLPKFRAEIFMPSGTCLLLYSLKLIKSITF